MRTRQQRKRKGEGEKEEEEEERHSEEEVQITTSLLQPLGERASHKFYGKHVLSVSSMDRYDGALFVLAAAAIKKSMKKWKELQHPARTEEDAAEMGEEANVQTSPRARRQSLSGRKRKASRSIHSAYSSGPETTTLLAGKIIATAFFEPSTRTRCSFETATIRLGGHILSCGDMTSTSSVKKGETLEDTIRMLGAYADAIVLRHPEQNSAARAAAVLDLQTEAAETCCLLNAGDGVGEHPTQALMDLFTIAELFPEWWTEQLQRLTKEKQDKDSLRKKDQNEEHDRVKKEDKGERTQPDTRSDAMDSQQQTASASHSSKEEGAVSEGQQAEESVQEVTKTEPSTEEETAAIPAAAPQGNSSTSSQDKSATDTSAIDAEKKLGESRILTVAFVGDLKHGRTVHSLALLLSKFNCRIITLSSSDLALPAALEDSLRGNFAAQGGSGIERLTHGSDFPNTIGATDVLYMTRMQTERYAPSDAESTLANRKTFTLTRALLESHAKPHAKVLHPLPRVDEIDTNVDATPFCAYFTQAENGVYMRMALLAIVLNPHTWHILFGM